MLQQRAEHAAEAGNGVAQKNLAQQRHFELPAIDHASSPRRTQHVADRVADGGQTAQDQHSIVAHRVAQGQQHDGGPGQTLAGAFQPLEQRGKLGHEEHHQGYRDQRPHAGQKGRIDHRADQPAFQLLLQIEEAGRPPQRVFEKRALHARVYHAHGQVAEHPRMTGEGLVERDAFAHVLADVLEHFPQRSRSGLLGQQVQCIEQGHAVLEQVGQLGQVSRQRAGLDGGRLPPRKAARPFRPHADRAERPFGQRGQHAALVGGASSRPPRRGRRNLGR